MKRTDIISKALRSIYSYLHGDLTDFLNYDGIKQTNDRWKSKSLGTVGYKWRPVEAKGNFLLLQVTDAELKKIKSDKDLAQRFIKYKKNLVVFNATGYIDDTNGDKFLINQDWFDDKTGFNSKTCELLKSYTKAKTGDEYKFITKDEEAFMKIIKDTPESVPIESSIPKEVEDHIDTAPTDDATMPLNLILYGPPGTGKTYNTIFKALDVLGVHALNASGAPTSKSLWFDNEEADRKQALVEFNKMKNAGRIVFTTFHQSMNYEDFIEGIKPVLDGKSVGYKIEDGIFKQISEAASKDRYNNNYVLIIDEINRGNVANIFGELITLIEDDKRITKWDKSTRKYIENPEGIRVKLPYSHAPKTMEKEETSIREEGEEEKGKDKDKEKDKEKEKDKDFGVPGNLYIIGTMNTADRSVEALDSALRRRFTFEELMPKPELLRGVNIKGLDKTLEDLLKTINDRIAALKDREHQIGHSYFKEFFGRKTEVEPKELEKVFTDKIIPLLQEYFYGDYEKIWLVVGDGFVNKVSDKIEFAGGESYEDLPERYFIKKKPDMTEALKNLMNVK